MNRRIFAIIATITTAGLGVEARATPLFGTDATPLFGNFNQGGVSQGSPTAPTLFTLAAATYISEIDTYHVSDTFTSDSLGIASVGSFSATDYQNSYANFWSAPVDIYLGPGTYTITDANPSTWAFNDGSNNEGFAEVFGTDAPEPASIALLVSGLVGIGAISRRRQAPEAA